MQYLQKYFTTIDVLKGRKQIVQGLVERSFEMKMKVFMLFKFGISDRPLRTSAEILNLCIIKTWMGILESLNWKTKMFLL